MKRLAALAFLGLGFNTHGPGYNASYSENVRRDFLQVYSDRVPTPLCLEGEMAGSTYSVDGTKIPKLAIVNDTLKINLESCHTESYLGLAHAHRDLECKMTRSDIKRFMEDEKAEIETIICHASTNGDSVKALTTFKRAINEALAKQTASNRAQ